MKKKFSLKNEYKKSWNYIKECKNFIYFIMGIFFVFALIGFFVTFPEFFVQKIMEMLQEILSQTEGMNSTELMVFIFLNNLKSSFFGMIFGFAFGIYPILVSVINGIFLGFVASLSVSYGGISVLWRLLPHGIFELPAVFISLGLGLKLGSFIFQKNKSESFKKYFWNSFRVFVFVILPLLFIAAIIEGFLIFYLG